MTTIDHTCIHVLDPDRSATFYRDALKAKHRALGLIFDELNGGIYFIKDPDGHILEILPPKQ